MSKEIKEILEEVNKIIDNTSYNDFHWQVIKGISLEKF